MADAFPSRLVVSVALVVAVAASVALRANDDAFEGPADPPVGPIDTTNMVRDYVRGSGEALKFVTHGIDDLAVLAFEAFNPAANPWEKVEGYSGLVVSYRGGNRLLPAEKLDELEPGFWMIRIFAAEDPTLGEAWAPLTIHAPKSVTDPDDDKSGEEPPAEEVPEPVEPEPQPQPQQDDETVVLPPWEPEPSIGKGFTQFRTSPDSRVIAVPSGGNIRSAYDQLRDGYPDYLLLQAGGTYSLQGIDWTKSGRSKHEPMVVGVYGDGPRPVIKLYGRIGFELRGCRDVAFVGLKMTAPRRDPTSKEFNGGGDLVTAFKATNTSIQNIRIEDCFIEFMAGAMSFIGDNIRDISIHRSIVTRSYKLNTMGNVTALWAERVNGLSLTETVLDHSGWEPRVPGAGKTIFNHNCYLVNCKNVLFDRVITSRASAFGMNLRTGFADEGRQENITVRNCLFVGNTHGVQSVAKPYSDGKAQAVSIGLKMYNNVLTNLGGRLPQGGRDIRQCFGMPVWAWNNAELRDNLFIDPEETYSSFAIEVQTWKWDVKDFRVTGNVAHRWDNTKIWTIGGGVFQQGNKTNLADAAYKDGSRSIAKYMQSQGGGGGYQALVEWALSRPRGKWDSRPFDVVDYMLDGFNLK